MLCGNLKRTHHKELKWSKCIPELETSSATLQKLVVPLHFLEDLLASSWQSTFIFALKTPVNLAGCCWQLFPAGWELHLDPCWLFQSTSEGPHALSENRIGLTNYQCYGQHTFLHRHFSAWGHVKLGYSSGGIGCFETQCCFLRRCHKWESRIHIISLRVKL